MSRHLERILDAAGQKVDRGQAHPGDQPRPPDGREARRGNRGVPAAGLGAPDLRPGPAQRRRQARGSGRVRAADERAHRRPGAGGGPEPARRRAKRRGEEDGRSSKTAKKASRKPAAKGGRPAGDLQTDAGIGFRRTGLTTAPAPSCLDNPEGRISTPQMLTGPVSETGHVRQMFRDCGRVRAAWTRFRWRVSAHSFVRPFVEPWRCRKCQANHHFRDSAVNFTQ